MIKFNRGKLRTILVVLAVLFMSYKAWSFNIGVGVYFIGLLLHVISKGFLYRNRELAVKGPYSFVRHPFYVANLLLDIGIIFMSGYPVFILVYPPLYYIAYNKVILGEESVLIGLYGDIYKKYMDNVPRYFPKIMPYIKNWYSGFSWENILREREISRVLRLVSYPVSFLVIHEIIKVGYLGARNTWVLLGISCITVLLWASYLVHNLVERNRLFKDKKQNSVNLYFIVCIIIAGGALILIRYLQIKSDIMLLPLTLLFSLLVVLFVLFIIISNFAKKINTKFE